MAESISSKRLDDIEKVIKNLFSLINKTSNQEAKEGYRKSIDRYLKEISSERELLASSYGKRGKDSVSIIERMNKITSMLENAQKNISRGSDGGGSDAGSSDKTKSIKLTADSIENIFKELPSIISRSFENTLRNSLKSLDKIGDKGSAKIEKGYLIHQDNLAQIAKDLHKELEKELKDMAVSVEDTFDDMRDTAKDLGKEIKRTDDAVDKLSKSTKDMGDRMRESTADLAQTFSIVQTRAGDLTQVYEESVLSNREFANKFGLDTAQVTKEMSASFSKATKDLGHIFSVPEFNEQWQQLYRAFGESATEYAETAIILKKQGVATETFIDLMNSMKTKGYDALGVKKAIEDVMSINVSPVFRETGREVKNEEVINGLKELSATFEIQSHGNQELLDAMMKNAAMGLSKASAIDPQLVEKMVQTFSSDMLTGEAMSSLAFLGADVQEAIKSRDINTVMDKLAERVESNQLGPDQLEKVLEAFSASELKESFSDDNLKTVVNAINESYGSLSPLSELAKKIDVSLAQRLSSFLGDTPIAKVLADFQSSVGIGFSDLINSISQGFLVFSALKQTGIIPEGGFKELLGLQREKKTVSSVEVSNGAPNGRGGASEYNPSFWSALGNRSKKIALNQLSAEQSITNPKNFVGEYTAQKMNSDEYSYEGFLAATGRKGPLHLKAYNDYKNNAREQFDTEARGLLNERKAEIGKKQWGVIGKGVLESTAVGRGAEKAFLGGRKLSRDAYTLFGGRLRSDTGGIWSRDSVAREDKVSAKERWGTLGSSVLDKGKNLAKGAIDTAGAVGGVVKRATQVGAIASLAMGGTTAMSGISALLNTRDAKGNFDKSSDAYKEAAKETGLGVAQALTPLLGPLGPALSFLLPYFQDSLAPQLEQIGSMVGDFVGDIMKMLQPFVKGVVDSFVPMVTQILKDFMPILQTMLPPVLDLIKMLLPPIQSVIQSTIPAIGALLEALKTPMLLLAKVVVWATEKIIIPVLNWLLKGFKGFFDTFGKFWNWILKKFHVELPTGNEDTDKGSGDIFIQQMVNERDNGGNAPSVTATVDNNTTAVSNTISDTNVASNAKGLSFVPKKLLSWLHPGEAVLDRNEADNYRKNSFLGSTLGGLIGSIGGPIGNMIGSFIGGKIGGKLSPELGGDTSQTRLEKKQTMEALKADIRSKKDSKRDTIFQGSISDKINTIIRLLMRNVSDDGLGGGDTSGIGNINYSSSSGLNWNSDLQQKALAGDRAVTNREKGCVRIAKSIASSMGGNIGGSLTNMRANKPAINFNKETASQFDSLPVGTIVGATYREKNGSLAYAWGNSDGIRHTGTVLPSTKNDGQLAVWDQYGKEISIKDWFIKYGDRGYGGIAKLVYPEEIYPANMLVGGNLDVDNIPQHQLGLDYVPHDNYLAFLHEGERVLTDEQARLMDSVYNNTKAYDTSPYQGFDNIQFPDYDFPQNDNSEELASLDNIGNILLRIAELIARQGNQKTYTPPDKAKYLNSTGDPRKLYRN